MPTVIRVTRVIRTMPMTFSQIPARAMAGLAVQRDNVVHVPMKPAGNSASMFCRDGFHPSTSGHRRWARELAPIALEHLDRVDLRPESGRNSDPAG